MVISQNQHSAEPAHLNKASIPLSDVSVIDV